MKKGLVLLFLLCSLIVPQICFGAYAHESITVSTTAIGLTKATYCPTGGGVCGNVTAFCTVETASIRIWWDGTAPTSSVGHIYNPGDTFILIGSDDVGKLLMIRSGGSDAAVRCTYE